ncbi:MAG: amidohydrolase family protein, partial [Clostridiales bacterium]|nr:amidohydrolase family protein [Clostridiales bacterium]
MSILIQNAMIMDGTKAPGYMADIFIVADRIQKIITDPIQAQQLVKDATDVIDAKGLVCAPGFIDTHSHSDLKVLSDPMLLPKLKQGITTEVLGQDGIAMAPLPLAYIEPWKKNLAGLDGENNAIDW